MDILQARPYPVVYAGPRWEIVYGSYEGVERFALLELHRMMQRFLPYVIRVSPASAGAAAENQVLVGTAANHPRIADLADSKLIGIPDHPQGYAMACMGSPWGPGRVMAVAGRSPAGVLHGVEDLNARVLARLIPDGQTPERLRRALDQVKDFQFTERPHIENRGIWTWGYVIYDYRRFLDHMARLRMNMLTIWNDCPPVNAREVIEYAHGRGIRIVLGFHWGWGLEGVDLSNDGHRRQIRDHVVRNYRENYRGLGMDGIYFQTLTEHNTLETAGRSTAAWACQLVNETAAALYEIDPALYIQFGLHATSIRGKYADLKPLDPRVTIVWEDAGVTPYAYISAASWPGGADGLHTADGTVEYSKKLATFRPGTEFALVPKGWANLRWGEEFEHHGPYLLGERAPDYIRRRFEDRRPRWDQVNAAWLTHFQLAARFYREVLDCRPRRITATGLVEDGLFEHEIQPSVALFAETLWNPRRADDEILTSAMSPYYRSA